MLLHLCWKSQRLILFPHMSRHSYQLHHPFFHHRPCFYLHPIPLTHPQLFLTRHNQPQPRHFVALTAPIIHWRNYRIMYAFTSHMFAPTNLLPCFQVRLKVHVILWPIMFHITVTSLNIALLLPRSVKSQNPKIIPKPSSILNGRRRCGLNCRLSRPMVLGLSHLFQQGRHR